MSFNTGFSLRCSLLLLALTSVLSPAAQAQRRGWNLPPAVSGTPGAVAKVGVPYSFTPQASDPENRTLTFSITGTPAWATFSSSTGTLSGTPTASRIGTSGSIVIAVADRRSRVYLPAFRITVQSDSTSTNAAPTISGSPATAINFGSPYSFSPIATDPDGDTLAFSIANKPAWATFSTTTGRLSGTPAAASVGAFPGIVISVSDGTVSKALNVFAINVTQVANGSATLSWTAPTQNTNGTQLTNLSGYRIYYGTSASALTQTIDITNASISTYLINNLSPATWYFAIAARTSAGADSSLSNVASKSVN